MLFILHCPQCLCHLQQRPRHSSRRFISILHNLKSCHHQAAPHTWFWVSAPKEACQDPGRPRGSSNSLGTSRKASSGLLPPLIWAPLSTSLPLSIGNPFQFSPALRRRARTRGPEARTSGLDDISPTGRVPHASPPARLPTLGWAGLISTSNGRSFSYTLTPPAEGVAD